MGSLTGAQKQAAPGKGPSSKASRNRTQPAAQRQNPIPYLQRTIGNQAVLRLLRTQAGGSQAVPAANSVPAFPAPTLRIQPKLTVNSSGDAYEQEADRVAEQVMRMPQPQAAVVPTSGSAPAVQRKCACGGSCEDCRKKEKLGEPARVQMKAAGPGTAAAGMEAPPIVHEVLSSPGQPLDSATRAFMEPRFGRDFSNVRVHTDNRAAESAKAVNAKAYTVGSKVVFGAGEYAPGSKEGQRLLGHELAHVVQQNDGGSAAAIHDQPVVTKKSTPKAVVQRGPGPPLPAAANPPAWLGKWQAGAVHVKGNIWDVKLPTLGGDSWVGPYDELTAYIKEQGYSGKMEAAHIVGGEHLKDIQSSFSYQKAPCIAVDKTLHTTWTSQTSTLQTKYLGGRAWGRVGRPEVTKGDVKGLYNELYSGHPELREMAGNIIKPATSVSGEITVPQRGSVTLSGGTTRPVTTVSGESTVQDVLVGEAKTASKAGRFATRLARVGEIAGPLVDAFLMLLNYRDVGIDASAFQKLSAEKLQPIIEKELKARSAEIAKVAEEPEAFWGVYANVRCELHYRFVPSAKGTSLGGLQLYDVRFLGMSITAQNVNKADWNKERGRKEGEGIQEATLSILIYVPPHPELFPSEPETTDPLYFASSRQRSPLPPQPVTTDELLRWARRNHPRLFDDPRLSQEILSSNEFTGSQQAREKALNDLRRRIQEEKIPW